MSTDTSPEQGSCPRCLLRALAKEGVPPFLPRPDLHEDLRSGEGILCPATLAALRNNLVEWGGRRWVWVNHYNVYFNPMRKPDFKGGWAEVTLTTSYVTGYATGRGMESYGSWTVIGDATYPEVCPCQSSVPSA